MSNKTTLKDALQLMDNYRCNNSHLLENKIITALAEDNAKLREALEMADAQARIAFVGNLGQRNNKIMNITADALTATDPEKRTI